MPGNSRPGKILYRSQAVLSKKHFKIPGDGLKKGLNGEMISPNRAGKSRKPVSSSDRPAIGITCGRESAEDWVPAATGRLMDFLFQDYVTAVEHAGGLPMILPPTAAVETFVEALSKLDGLLLTGGGDVCPAMYGEKRGPGLKGMDPQRDACETAALREARKRGLPVLGICRGIQIMAVAFGGTLYRDLPGEKEAFSGHWQQAPRARHSHHVRVTRGSRLFRILEDAFVPVNSHHHQAVKTVPPGFTVSASAEDGLVEALEDPVHPFFLAVQWHPEGTFDGDAPSRKIFEAFIHAARRALSS